MPRRTGSGGRRRCPGRSRTDGRCAVRVRVRDRSGPRVRARPAAAPRGRSSQRRRLPSSSQACSADTSRLGSATDCSRNSNRQPGSWPSGSSVSVSRNIARAGPGSSAPIASHGASASASDVEFARVRVETAMRRGQCGQPGFLGWKVFRSTATPTAAARSAAGNCVARPRIRECTQRRQVARSYGACGSDSARQTGGIAAISDSVPQCRRPWTTGRQNATGPCSSTPSAGRTRPRATRFARRPPDRREYATDAP